jgi:hypothetical protein
MSIKRKTNSGVLGNSAFHTSCDFSEIMIDFDVGTHIPHPFKPKIQGIILADYMT